MEKRRLKSKSNKVKNKIFWFRFLAVSVALSAFAFGCFAAKNSSQEQDLKNKIQGLRNQIDQYRAEIYAKGEKEETLQDEIESLEKNIRKIELQIQQTELLIQGLDLEIENKQGEIDEMQKEISAKREGLARFMQELYEQGEATPVEVALGNENISDFFLQAD